MTEMTENQLTATFEPIRRRPRHNADEMDAFSRSARRALICLGRPGVVRKTKARAARRSRHNVRQALRTAY
jgi:hypothetical protein